MALSFALDFLGWKCLSRYWVGEYPRFGNGCEEKPSEFPCIIILLNCTNATFQRQGGDVVRTSSMKEWLSRKEWCP